MLMKFNSRCEVSLYLLNLTSQKFSLQSRINVEFPATEKFPAKKKKIDSENNNSLQPNILHFTPSYTFL